MLTLPDLKEKQILVIQTKRGAENKIKFWNENIRYVRDGEIVNQASCWKIMAIFVIGDFSITNVLIEKCKFYGISIFLLNRRLYHQANILSQTEGNYILRQKQYQFQDELNFNRQLVENKIKNQQVLLKEDGTSRSNILTLLAEKALRAKDEKELLGIEGNASKDFFKLYFSDFNWKRRSPRTRQDIINPLLDIGYYYLFNFTDCLLRFYGLDTYKGIYHKLFFARRSLSCDIMEPFRCLVERRIRKALNLKQIKVDDFHFNMGKYELQFKESQKYGQLFLETILDHREDIFKYIQQFYHCLMRDQTNYPKYTIRKR